MDWCVTIRRIAACSAEIRCCPEALDTELKTLVALLDHGDVLVAYTAKVELQNVLSDQRVMCQGASNIIVSLISTRPAVWKRKSTCYRFQLLRELIKTKVDVDGDSNGDNRSENSVDDGEDSERVDHYPYYQAVLMNLEVVAATVHSACVSMAMYDSDGGVVSICYEALVFLSALMKQLRGLEAVERSQVSILNQLMQTLMGEVFMPMDYASQPVFVSCAVLVVFTDFHEIVLQWKNRDQGGEEECGTDIFSKWLDKFFMWSVQSSCTAEALRLLDSVKSSTTTSQAAFICERGQYPFLQQWLLCVSRIGVAVVEASSYLLTGAEEIKVLDPSKGSNEWVAAQLPNRRQLFAIISEQDDVMIEVLNALVCTTVLADDGSGIPDHHAHRLACVSRIIKHMAAEYDPDLLFADLVDMLGRDHLVLLDLLVSNETRMLEYFMRYLRYLSARWDHSKIKLQAGERLESVLSMLIRLRLEIDRLVAAGLFPYNAKPLTRRLLAIEQLYEGVDA